MYINNIFLEESLHYTEQKPSFWDRSNEIADLDEIAEYCKHNEEKILYDDEKIWYEEIEKGMQFCDWLFSGEEKGREDDRRMFLEILDKKSKAIEGTKLCGIKSTNNIYLSLGEYAESVSNEKEYIACRRDILSEITDVEEYEEFMHSCFINSCFAENILQEMRHIEDFAMHTKEITKNLAVLNDEAIDLYNQYHDNLKEAMDILSAKLLECSGDANHRKFLFFPFTYEEVFEGETVAREKEIMCEPHLKLINKHSNLRIYFQWKDEQVGRGEKVLVGRIGGHPY